MTSLFELLRSRKPLLVDLAGLFNGVLFVKTVDYRKEESQCSKVTLLEVSFHRSKYWLTNAESPNSSFYKVRLLPHSGLK